MDETPLDGTTVLLTGGTSGIGQAAAERLAARGATVGVVGRDRDRGEAMETSTGAGSISFHRADLAVQEEVRSLADRVQSSYDRLDVLAHNAGISQGTRTETPDGIESTFAVNHLAPYRLTHDLLDLVRADDGGRIVVTASGVHYDGTLDFEDLEYESTAYDALEAYARSKLANVAFTLELADRLNGPSDDGSGTAAEDDDPDAPTADDEPAPPEDAPAVTANCFHPGFVPSTGLFRNARLRTRVLIRVLSVVPGVGTTPETGGKRLVRLATDPRYARRSGCYVGDDGVESPAAAAEDPETRDRLWEVSADYVGVDPDWPSG